MKRTLLIGCLLLVFAGTGIAKQTGIITGDKVRVRTKPTTKNSETVVYVNKGDKVVILGKTDKKEKIGSMEDYWYQIEFNENGIMRQYWIFGNFVKLYLEVASKNKDNVQILDLSGIKGVKVLVISFKSSLTIYLCSMYPLKNYLLYPRPYQVLLVFL